jgi:uncharacterized coiled-coil DUF342 family protein
MSDRINQLIESIREKSMLLKDQVANEKRSNENLQQEIQGLQQEIAQKNEQITGLKARIDQLNENIQSAKEQNIEQASPNNMLSDEQIDELVGEIEYCLGQLKK